MAQRAGEKGEDADTAAFLSSVVALNYDIGPLVDWTVLHRGTNDTYLLVTAQGRYILRRYGRDWRSSAEISYEIDLLRHLERKGVPVAGPIARSAGGFLSRTPAPDGERYAVLFAYAPGAPPPWPPDPAYYRPYGRAAAAIHAALDDFSTPHHRAPLDLAHLVGRPLRALLHALGSDRPEADELRRVAERVSAGVTATTAPLDWGACHGDFNGANCHARDGTVTFFDFDLCGPGWRAYDLAVLRWAAALNRADAIWPAFLDGYQDGRRLADEEVATIPSFVAIRHLWWFGTHARTGIERQGEAYVEKGMRFLRRWEKDYLTD